MCLATIYGKKQEDETILLKNGKLGCKDQLCRQLNSMKGYNNQAVDTV